MKKEDIINTKPSELPSDACKIFDSDQNLKKLYEKKWDTALKCPSK